MRIKLKRNKKENDFIDKVNELSGENVYSCYQCGRCSAGCPFAFEMDILPNQMIRLVQLGQQEELIGTKALFLCASCFTCQSRCPKGINIANVAEAVRSLIDPKGKDHCGPDEIPVELADELPQQVLVAVYRKFSK